MQRPKSSQPNSRYSQEIYPVYTTLISGVNVPYNQGYRPKLPSVVVDVLENRIRPETPPDLLKTEIIQTIFRESETQTEPYTPDVKTPYDKGLEVLTLGWLSWKNGLPAGMREVVIIERARQRRSWERALPPPCNEFARQIREMILEAIELNEWTHREVELAALNSVRFEMAQICLKQNLSANKIKYENRLSNYIANKTVEKEQALRKTRLELKRSLRKLVYQRYHVSRRYKRMDVFTELNDRTSEFYAPQKRYGVDPRRGHEVISPEFRYWNVLTYVDALKLDAKLFDYRRRSSAFDFVKKSKSTKTYKQLCLRETKWTERYLDKLYSLLKALRLQRMKSTKRPCRLKQLIPPPPETFKTPAVAGVSDEDEALFQSCLYLQKTIKGRAIQTVMFEGRVRCQELLEELKSTHALLDHIDDIQAKSRKSAYQAQRNMEIEELERKRKAEILLALEGQTVSEILDNLSKELLRLEDERRTHAAALLADKERHRREAEEAGRRQVEEQRRRELDEMRKQIVKIYQNCVDFIEDEYSTELREAVSAQYGRMKAEEYARGIDLAAHQAQTERNDLEHEELVADLVHNFALPEVEKEMVRKRLRDRQKTMLSACHDEIYSQIEKLVHSARSPTGALRPLPRPQKHKVPPTFRVKFLKLTRAGTSDGSPGQSAGSSQTSLDENWHDLRQLEKMFENAKNGEDKNEDNWSSGFSRQEVILK